MRKGQASLTALAVAFGRSLASHTHAALLDPDDALSERFLPAPVAHALAVLRKSEHAASGIARLSLGMVDHLALRSAIIDARLTRELERGVAQLVIVGAGLDTRAHRLAALAHARVFEVDHPDSQRDKRERAQELPLYARALDYIALDLNAGDLAQHLADAGHDPRAASVWLLEGLVPYLEPATLERTLAAIARASAPGSALLITYVTPELVVLRHGRALVQSALRLAGEPMRSVLEPRELAQRLTRAGFSLEEDSDTHAWARELAPHAARKPLIAYERLAIARKP